MTEVKSTPALRFPEFEGEWKVKSLGNICSKIGSGKTPRGGDKVYQTNGVPFIRSQNVNNDILTLDQTHIPTSVHLEMKGSTVLPNDILLNITGASIGRSCIVPEELKEANVNQHVSIIRLKEDDPKFLQAILSSSKGQKLVFEAQTGSGREGLNFESIKKFKIRFPSPTEQQKIASFLSAVNNRIQLLKQKKEKLQSYKNGVLQQIFSQQIRFKDENGNEFPDWVEMKLGQICLKKSSGVSANTLLENNGNYKIYGATGYLQNVDFYQEENPYISIVKDGAGVGRVLLCEPKSSVLGTLDKIIPKESVDLFFLHLTLTNIPFDKYKTGSTIPHIYFKDYSNEKISIPSLPEQQKIASFLTSLDKAIEAVQSQTDRSAEFKKGLLQQLFV